MKTFALRFLLLAFVATALSLTVWAQTNPGIIKAVKVEGDVFKLTKDGQSVKLAEDAILSESDTITTGKASSVVLVFMNGATVKLGENTKLAIEEFKMDPLDETIKVSELKSEPKVSKTRLNLSYGEMVGEVKHLNKDEGSYFDIQTPVGAAGIRGTTFRIVFRPTGDGKAYNFTLSTAEGVVLFTGTAQGSTPVAVPQDKEVVVTAQFDPTTNTITSVQISNVQDISPAAAQQISNAVGSAMSQAQQATNFTPTEQKATSNGESGGSSGNPGTSNSNTPPPTNNTETTPTLTPQDGA